MFPQDQSHRMGRMLWPRMAPLHIRHHYLHLEARHHCLRDHVFGRTDPQHSWVPLTSDRSCFLSGPSKQLKDMFKKTRWILTLLYVGSLIATLVLAFVLPENLKGLVLIPLIVQIISYFLYTLSFVPFGRRIIKQCCKCLVEGD